MLLQGLIETDWTYKIKYAVLRYLYLFFLRKKQDKLFILYVPVILIIKTTNDSKPPVWSTDDAACILSVSTVIYLCFLIAKDMVRCITFYCYL